MKKSVPAAMIFFLISLVVSFAPAIAAQVKVIKVIVASANVRLKPDFDSQVLTRVPSGTLLESTTKTGDWYLVTVSSDEKGEAVTGYIHRSTIQEVQTAAKPSTEPTPPTMPEKAPQPIPPPQKPPEAAVPISAGTTRPPSGGSLFTGFFIKFGWMASPDAGGFGKAWLSGLGYDIGLSRNLSLGIEVQPAYRSYPEIDLSILPVMAFANAKGGENMGRLIPFLKFLDLVGGLGLGLEAAYARTTFEGQTYTNFKTRFAFHLLLGAEFEIKNFRLLLDYQMTQVSDPNVNPNYWRHYLLFGIRF